MEKLGDSDGKGRNTNINHFASLFESYDEEGTNTSPKPKKTPVIVLSEDEDKGQNKREHKDDDE